MGGIRSGGSHHWSRLYRNHIACRRRPFRVVDETIALDLGVIGQETTGVGGFSMAVRTIPVLMEYCELIKNMHRMHGSSTLPIRPVW